MNFGWDAAAASALIGKTVLIGITTRDDADNVIGQTQYFGVVESVSERDGIVVKLDGADRDRLVLPPTPFLFTPAKPGVYRLRSNGREIRNPDFIAVWTVHEPREGERQPAGGGWRLEPAWDKRAMRALVGAVVMVEIRSIEENGVQARPDWRGFGRIASGSERDGIEIALVGPDAGGTYRFPPHPEAFVPAPGGLRTPPGADGVVHSVAFVARMVLRRTSEGMEYSFVERLD